MFQVELDTHYCLCEASLITIPKHVELIRNPLVEQLLPDGVRRIDFAIGVGESRRQ